MHVFFFRVFLVAKSAKIKEIDEQWEKAELKTIHPTKYVCTGGGGREGMCGHAACPERCLRVNSPITRVDLESKSGDNKEK